MNCDFYFKIDPLLSFDIAIALCGRMWRCCQSEINSCGVFTEVIK